MLINYEKKNEEKPCPICIQLKAQKRFRALLNHIASKTRKAKMSGNSSNSGNSSLA